MQVIGTIFWGTIYLKHRGSFSIHVCPFFNISTFTFQIRTVLLVYIFKSGVFLLYTGYLVVVVKPFFCVLVSCYIYVLGISMFGASAFVSHLWVSILQTITIDILQVSLSNPFLYMSFVPISKTPSASIYVAWWRIRGSN